ncbi:MAG: branched-chain amino acid ABC transporter permease [Geminocystis sp.]|nr:branched-chain amino acid ABC transporter permease [Geminocystis sp.]MCS7147877.1 branched-chain amino acid ABC transporter permease [Geminocystis sp.]MCX8078703.1 branched-chain amino acid ABC transporter permease [Geminocystis sp.]MDW8117035.1 branched-chain amino acid ABC transporter permease [Geminocystis sp.]MDW8462426.1 branched-chain amino acid ABC transporter permease [Geminocystis sp.]
MVEYLVFLTISASIYALFALGLNLQWGFTGLINFGHVAFLTLGAYFTVLLEMRLGVPMFISMLIAVLACCLFGLIIGFSSIKLREDYLAIVTIGAGELVRLIVQNEEQLTNGTFGLQGYNLPLGKGVPNFFGKLVMIATLTFLAIFALWQLFKNLKLRLKLAQEIQGKSFQPPSRFSTYFWGAVAVIFILVCYVNGVIALYNYTYKAGLMLLTLIALAVVYWGLETLVHSPWGRVLKAIREDEEVAISLGKNVFWYKLQAFMLGGGIAGVAGAFYSWQLTTIYPSSFEPLMTFNAWIIVVLGGAGNNAGVLLGAIIFWAYDSLTRFLFGSLPFFTSAQVASFRVMVIGLILILLMLWRPQGILGKKGELSLNI